MVVVVRIDGRGASDLTCLVLDPSEVTICSVIITILMLYSILCVGGVAWWCLCLRDCGTVLVRFGWIVVVVLDSDWCRNGLRTGAI